MIAAVSGITSDTDWFDDSYENRDTTAGLVTKKTDTEIFILVQSRRIADAQKILVTFHDGTEAEAQIKGSDSITGLSVLSVPVSSVPAANRAEIKEAELGTSANTILTGAPVIAIGSPTGTLETVIYGNVTGSGENLEIADNYLCRITTDIYGSNDATGFLINLDGEVVGMIDMRYKDSNVPGKTKAYLGVSGIDVTQEISEANEIPLGVWVTRVEEDSPAMAAGIQKGDVITGVGKNDILTMAGLTIQLTQTEPGETVTLRIMRRNGGSFEEIKVSVTAQ